MEESENIKIIVLGETGTGKTNLINAYFDKPFNKDNFTTTAPEFFQKELKVDGCNCLVGLWDTAGQEKYRSLSKVIMNGSKIVVFVYDITNKKTFEELNFWVKSVEEVLGKEPILGIAANKIDLFEEQVVEKEEGEKYAKAIGALFAETSAKEDQKGFQDFIFKLLQKYIQKNGLGTKNVDNGRILLDKKKINTKKKKKKC